MSTRTNIIIRGGDFRVTLYRHWDGYPAETGAHLLELAIKTPQHGYPNSNAAHLTNTLIRHTYTPDYDGSRPMHLYEITTEIHGDIEHLYIVRFANCGGIEIGHTPIEIGSDRDPSDLYSAAAWYSVNEFRAFVNAERAKVNARCGSRGMADAYPMV